MPFCSIMEQTLIAWILLIIIGVRFGLAYIVLIPVHGVTSSARTQMVLCIYSEQVVKAAGYEELLGESIYLIDCRNDNKKSASIA